LISLLFLETLPIKVTILIQYIAQAVEAYISPWATTFSKEKSKSAVEKVFKYALRTYQNGGSDMEARTQMLQASFDAGVAISIGAVGLIHAMAHTIGAKYGVPHGNANAMIMPHVLEFYGEAAAPLLAELARVAGLGTEADSDASLARLFIGKIKDFLRDMEMPTTVEKMRPSQVTTVAKVALAESYGEKHGMLTSFPSFMRDSGYPTCKYMSQEDCESIFRKLLPKPQGVSEQARL